MPTTWGSCQYFYKWHSYHKGPAKLPCWVHETLLLEGFADDGRGKSYHKIHLSSHRRLITFRHWVTRDFYFFEVLVLRRHIALMLTMLESIVNLSISITTDTEYGCPYFDYPAGANIKDR